MKTLEKDQDSSGKSKNNAPKMHQKAKSRFPKTDERYWQERITLRKFTSNGIERTVSGYQVQLCYKGDRRWLNTHEGNKAKAAKVVKSFHETLRAVGWDEANRRFGRDVGKRIERPTVGDYISAAQQFPDIKPYAMASYSSRFRTLVSEIMKIPSDGSKHDHFNGGYERWRKSERFVHGQYN